VRGIIEYGIESRGGVKGINIKMSVHIGIILELDRTCFKREEDETSMSRVPFHWTSKRFLLTF
jgi:hypothetical protein